MPFTAVLVYALMEVYKAFVPQGSRLRAFIPLVSILLGVVLGVAFYFLFPSYVLAKELPTAAIAGGVSGLAATGGHQALRFMRKEKPPSEE